jgi:hypothetical protein
MLSPGAGARPVGRKIGFTNRAIWPKYGVHQPIWGTVYDETLSFAADGRATVSLCASGPRFLSTCVRRRASALQKAWPRPSNGWRIRPRSCNARTPTGK